MPDPTGTGAEERRWKLMVCPKCKAVGHRKDCSWRMGTIPPHSLETVEVVPASALAALQERLEEVEGKTSWKAVAANIRAERDSLALEVERLREGIASALTSLATGPAKDGYAYAVLDEVLRDGDPEAGSESSNQQSVEGR
jgi:hypothetical protein